MPLQSIKTQEKKEPYWKNFYIWVEHTILDFFGTEHIGWSQLYCNQNFYLVRSKEDHGPQPVGELGLESV